MQLPARFLSSQSVVKRRRDRIEPDRIIAISGVATTETGSMQQPSTTSPAAKAADRGLIEHRSQRNILTEKRGAIAVVSALVLVVVIGFISLAVEIVTLLLVSRHMQSAADGAVLAASMALANGGNATAQLNEAQSVAGDATFVNGQDGASVTLGPPDASSKYFGAANALEAKISQPQSVLLLSVLYPGGFTVTAHAVAALTSYGSCVVALDTTDPGSFQMGGNATAVFQGCDLYVNSSSSSAASMAGTAGLTAQNVSIVGGVSGSSQITANIATGVPSPAPDPYAGYNFPPTPATACLAFTPPSPPSGHYCSVALQAGQSASLNGIYWVDNGFTINGGATLTGNNTTIIVNNGQVKINGNANVAVSAPTTDQVGNCCAGVAFYSSSSTNTATFNGGAGQQITGALYFPHEVLNFSGGNSTTQCTQLVAWQVRMTGTSQLTLNCTGTGILPVSPKYSLVE